MAYALTFLEGLMSFVSPCILPMLPIYVMFFAGRNVEKNTWRTVAGALGFIAGFTLVFVLLGALAGTFGAALRRYSRVIEIVFGTAIVLLGLNYAGFLRIPALEKLQRGGLFKGEGWWAPLAFGTMFALSFSPCVGAFLGAALMQAASGGGTLKGVALLTTYSLGLGLPLFLCTLFIDRLKSTLAFLSRHHRTISIVSGIALIALGLMMMTGLMNRLSAILL